MNQSHPEWLRVSAPSEGKMGELKDMLDHAGLHTVCESANCPNIGECFAGKTCTFMILGGICTRNCWFCAVGHGHPDPVNPDEPDEIARTVKKLGLKHVVITTVSRDDLVDGGAGHFAAVVRAVRRESPGAAIELLISDLKGRFLSLLEIVRSGPDIINHNVETVPRLYGHIRPQASYEQSLMVLEWVKKLSVRVITKSGMMLGLGENQEEVVGVMRDLRTRGCDILTLGQYLSPSPKHAPVRRYVDPGEFRELEQEGLNMGFLAVAAGPLVRSSYNASHVYSRVLQITRGA